MKLVRARISLASSPLALLITLPLAGAAIADPQETWLQAADFYEQALAQEHGWSVTPSLIDAAKEAAASGNDTLAQELADRALLTAEQALRQAQSEKHAWKSRVVQQ
jgi:hypothetical protein